MHAASGHSDRHSGTLALGIKELQSFAKRAVKGADRRGARLGGRRCARPCAFQSLNASRRQPLLPLASGATAALEAKALMSSICRTSENGVKLLMPLTGIDSCSLFISRL